MDKNKRKKIMQNLLQEEAQKELNKQSFLEFMRRNDYSDEYMDQDPKKPERNASEFKAQVLKVNPYGELLQDKYQVPKK